MSLNPVFVMVFAGNCHACINFKEKHYNEFQKALKEYPLVTSVEYNVKSIGDPLPSDAPKELNRFVKFYPCFFLIPGAIFQSALKGGKLKNILIYGATVNSEDKVIILPTTMATRDSLMEWIKNNVEHDVNLKSTGTVATVPEPKMIPTEGSVCSFKILSKR